VLGCSQNFRRLATQNWKGQEAEQGWGWAAETAAAVVSEPTFLRFLARGILIFYINVNSPRLI
jgi:hypothetical protein